MKLIAEWLMSLPKLKWVVVDIRASPSVPCYKLFENWPDPLGDAEALSPLKEKGGSG